MISSPSGTAQLPGVLRVIPEPSAGQGHRVGSRTPGQLALPRKLGVVQGTQPAGRDLGLGEGVTGRVCGPRE